MRGLKQQGMESLAENPRVASFTDAWIETVEQSDDDTVSFVASFTDAWIETLLGRSAN